MTKIFLIVIALIALTGWAHIDKTRELLPQLFLKQETQEILSKHYEYFVPAKKLDEIGNPYPCALIGDNRALENCYKDKAFLQVRNSGYFTSENIEYQCREKIQEVQTYAQKHNCPDGYTEFHKMKYRVWLDYLFPNKRKDESNE